MRTPLCDLLGIDVPILSVGFGVSAIPELAAAVSNAGGNIVIHGFVFPVADPHTFQEDFGDPRNPGTPYAHLHQGTDVVAAQGLTAEEAAPEAGVLAHGEARFQRVQVPNVMALLAQRAFGIAAVGQSGARDEIRAAMAAAGIHTVETPADMGSTIAAVLK